MADPLVELLTIDSFLVGAVVGIFLGIAIAAAAELVHLADERKEKWNG